MTERLTQRKAWKALSTHFDTIRRLHLRDLFANDPTRGGRMTAEGVGLFLDYSKNRITDETHHAPHRLSGGIRLALADRCHWGEKNVTENRAVLHVALRAPKDTSIVVDDENVVPQVTRRS